VAVRLFVGGLASTMSSERLQEMFAEYGVVEAVHVPTVRDTEKSRPFAFIEMATAEGADAAIRSLDGSTVDGRRIRVERAKAR
jgi:RNA recognition motif-containing protein